MPTEAWRISHQHGWKPAQAEDHCKRTQESWRRRWKRLTGKMPADITDERTKPDRLGHLVNLGIATEENAL
jgi:hypothetical protein